MRKREKKETWRGFFFREEKARSSTPTTMTLLLPRPAQAQCGARRSRPRAHPAQPRLRVSLSSPPFLPSLAAPPHPPVPWARSPSVSPFARLLPSLHPPPPASPFAPEPAAAAGACAAGAEARSLSPSVVHTNWRLWRSAANRSAEMAAKWLRPSGSALTGRCGSQSPMAAGTPGEEPSCGVSFPAVARSFLGTVEAVWRRRYSEERRVARG